MLIAPHAFSGLDQAAAFLLVNLTRQQIENSPAIESHEPVSRQYEEALYHYYGLPSDWDEGEMWGPGGFPEAPPLPHLTPSKQGNDPHLQSTQALNGYPIQTSEGAIGHVIDFMMDDKSWAICHLVVETGHWYSRKESVISPKHIARISYEEEKIFVDLTKEAILQAPEFHVPTLGATKPDTQNLAGQA